MEIDLVPDPGEGNPVVHAVSAALAEAGLARGDAPAATGGAWRRAGLLEAVDRSLPRNPTARPATDAPGASARVSSSASGPRRRIASGD